MTNPRHRGWAEWPDRFHAGYNVTSDGCWEWSRSQNGRGYGVIYFDGKLHLAHRASWLLAHGTWPTPGLVIDHECNNRACVNPEHLREMTSGENIMRAYPRGDEETERRRARWREASARTRAKRKGGGDNILV